MFSLGARLEACASLVREGKVMADIGTDHAYLPIRLVYDSRIPRAYASDIHEAPIESARENIARYGLNEKIITFTADGLDKIPSQDVDDIVIAGMGGDNIAAILADAQWLASSRYRLILQPMSRSERLREYLYTHHFAILNEKTVCEAKRIYTVICAEYSEEAVAYSEFDFYAGRLNPHDEYARRLLLRQAGILCSEAQGRTAAGDSDEAAHLKELSEQLRRYADGR